MHNRPVLASYPYSRAAEAPRRWLHWPSLLLGALFALLCSELLEMNQAESAGAILHDAVSVPPHTRAPPPPPIEQADVVVQLQQHRNNSATAARTPWFERLIPPALRDEYAAINPRSAAFVREASVSEQQLRAARSVVGRPERMWRFLRRLVRQRVCTRTLVLGGSVSFGSGTPSQQHAWTKRFQRWLDARYPCAANGSHLVSLEALGSGYNTLYAAMNFATAVRAAGRVDLIVVEYGVNDGWLNLAAAGDVAAHFSTAREDTHYTVRFFTELLVRQLLLMRPATPVLYLETSWKRIELFSPRYPLHARGIEASVMPWLAHRNILEYYGVPCVNAAAVALAQATRDNMTHYENFTKAWFADACCHPKAAVHLALVAHVAYYLEQETAEWRRATASAALDELGGVVDATLGAAAATAACVRGAFADAAAAAAAADDAACDAAFGDERAAARALPPPLSFPHAFDRQFVLDQPRTALDFHRAPPPRDSVLVDDDDGAWRFAADVGVKYGLLATAPAFAHLALRVRVAARDARRRRVGVGALVSYERMSGATVWLDTAADAAAGRAACRAFGRTFDVDVRGVVAQLQAAMKSTGIDPIRIACESFSYMAGAVKYVQKATDATELAYEQSIFTSLMRLVGCRYSTGRDAIDAKIKQQADALPLFDEARRRILDTFRAPSRRAALVVMLESRLTASVFFGTELPMAAIDARAVPLAATTAAEADGVDAVLHFCLLPFMFARGVAANSTEAGKCKLLSVIAK